MKIISINIGKPQIITVNDKEELTGYFKKPVNQSAFLGIDGVKNDTVIDKIHHGGKDKACYLYSCNHYNFWKKKYANLNWDFGMFGENLTIEGLDESQLRIGDVYSIGDALIQVSQPRQPCYKMGIKFNDPNIVPEFRDAPYPGVYVRVLKEGHVNNGDEFHLTASDKNAHSVLEIYELLYQTNPDKNEIQKAMKNEFLSDSAKKYLIEKQKPQLNKN